MLIKTVRNSSVRHYRLAIARWLPLGLLVIMSAPFVMHAFTFGLSGLSDDLSGQTYLFAANRPLANAAMFAHMLAGAIITIAAPLQLLAPVRERYPKIHRWCGYLLFVCALAAAFGGLVYIAMRQTIGGAWMDFAFSLYGVCVATAAVQAVRYARARDFSRHRDWALRLFVLAIGSWLYRLHYQIWYLATGGLWMEPDFSGMFDRFQLFAFFLPYLVAVEFYIRFNRLTARPGVS